MKKKLLFLLLPIITTCLGVGHFSSLVAAQSTQDFTISSFQANYYLGRNSKGVGQMTVKETITAVFPNYNQNHGLLRALPQKYKGVDLGLKVKSVINQTNGSTSYTSTTENSNLVLKIGDSSSFVQGVNTYVIEYTMKNVITDYEDYQELFWNINGTQWYQPINEVQMTLNMSPEVASSFNQQLRCFTGSYGQNSSDCTITSQVIGAETVVSARTNRTMLAGENLSVVVGFNQGSFKIDTMAVLKAKLTMYLPFVLGGLIPLVAIIILATKWFKKGRDARGKGLIIPQFVPYKDLVVVEADALLNEQLSQRGVTAQILELAIKKVLIISESIKDTKVLGLKVSSKTEYQLELVKPTDSLGQSEQSVISMLFGQTVQVGSKIEMNDLKDKLYKEYDKLESALPKELFSRGYFNSDPNKAATILLKPGLLTAAIFGFLIVLAVVYGVLSSVAAIFLTSILVISWVIVGLLGAKILPAKSSLGVEAKEYLLGLKEYIKLAEADRLKYLQSPEGAEKYGDPNSTTAKIKLFEKLLPYAVIFGLEKDWVNSFEGIYSEPPDWYTGNWSSFSTGALLGSISSFSAASSVSFAAPASSGGGSGFSGGGFSGGGGGGGGGGGW